MSGSLALRGDRLSGRRQIPHDSNTGLTPSIKDSHNGSHFYFSYGCFCAAPCGPGPGLSPPPCGSGSDPARRAAPPLASPRAPTAARRSASSAPSRAFPRSPPGLRCRRARLSLDRHRGWRGRLQRPHLEGGRHAEPGGVEHHQGHPGQRGRLDVVCDDHRPRPSPEWPVDPVRRRTGLPSNRILCLAEERDGSRNVLWVGTDKGLARWDGSTWSVFDVRETGLPHERITSLLALRTEQGPGPLGRDRPRARTPGGRPLDGISCGRRTPGGESLGSARGALRRALPPVGRDGRRRSRAVRRRGMDGGGGAPQQPCVQPRPPGQRSRGRALGGHRRRVWPTGPAEPGPSTTPRMPACPPSRSCACSPAGAAAGLSCGSG